MAGKGEEGYFPSRPNLTPVFVCALSFWALCAFGYAGGSGRAATLSLTFAAAGAAVGAVAVPFSLKRRWRMVALAIASAAIGFSLGCVQAAQVVQGGERLEGFSGNIEATVLEDGENKGFGENALVSARLDNGMTGTFEVRLHDVEPLLAGERLSGFAKFTRADYGKGPFAWADGSCGTLSMDEFEAQSAPFPLDALIAIRRGAIEAIGDSDDSHRLLQALVCGYRRNVRDVAVYSQFQTCGLAHLVAVSGAHLVIVTGLFSSLLRRLGVSRRLTVFVLIAVMLAYYVIAGMPVSALRATIMSALGLLAFFGGRRPSSLNAIGVGILALLVASPATCMSVSFVLSALATIGIALFFPLFRAWSDRLLLGRFPFVADSVSLTFAASILAQLYACSLFNQLPLIAPVANALTAPLFSFTCGAGLLFSLVASVPGASVALGGAAWLLSSVLSGAVSLLSRVPYASIPFSIGMLEALAASAAASVALWALWPKDARKAVTFCGSALALLIVASFVVADRSDSIVALDVGQGDSILVRSRGRSLLIDTGNQDARLLEQLGRNHVTHLDAVLVTHADDDHCGSIDALRKAVQVDRIVVAAGMVDCGGDSARSLMREAESTAREVVGAAQGDVLQVGAFSARVVWPSAFTEEGGNADSLCLLLEYDGDDDGGADHVALMTGDAEKDELDQMIAAGLVGDVDILKVGHHGSRNGSTIEEMRVLRPEVALISCGAHNRYGHPTQEILDQLDAVGAATFRTDQDGEIRCTLTPGRISVSCME